MNEGSLLPRISRGSSQRPGQDALARLSQREWFTTSDDVVFSGRNGGYLDDSALRRRYKVAQSKAGLRPLRFSRPAPHLRNARDPCRRSTRAAGMDGPRRLLDHRDRPPRSTQHRRRHLVVAEQHREIHPGGRATRHHFGRPPSIVTATRDVGGVGRLPPGGFVPAMFRPAARAGSCTEPLRQRRPGTVRRSRSAPRRTRGTARRWRRQSSRPTGSAAR